MTTASQTLSTMVEALPLEVQEGAVEQFRTVIADIMDDYNWDKSFKSTSASLEAFASNVRKMEKKAFDETRL
ncbi:MAG: hypothetical protein KU37_10915 [Sulfuricurvum sp. PC08-66]|nr:MAG: hypothetical protein KU37_10915 [Sulfuricurvum sp. PC08-66]